MLHAGQVIIIKLNIVSFSFISNWNVKSLVRKVDFSQSLIKKIWSDYV